MSSYTMMVNGMDFMDIRSFMGPKWPGQVSEICGTLGKKSETCVLLKSMPLGPVADKHASVFGGSEVSVKANTHMMQCYITNRF